jgi:hypothetical protein
VFEWTRKKKLMAYFLRKFMALLQNRGKTTLLVFCKYDLHWLVLKGSDDGVEYLELLGFCPLSRVRYSKN